MTQTAVSDLRGMLREARALVFDFDGTLVDSNEIKWRAFEVAFADVTIKREEVLQYCRGFDSVSRDDKFRHVCEQILKVPYAAEVRAKLHERFASATTSAIIAAPEIPGASAFLRSLGCRALTAILSSTPGEVLLHILRARGWADLVDTVRGAPIDKGAWLRRFKEDHTLGSAEIVFFGDSPDDAVAAGVAGCAFVGVANPRVAAPDTPWIEDFRPLVVGAG